MARQRKFRKNLADSLGFDSSASRGNKEIITEDGNFNVVKTGGNLLELFHPYHWLTSLSWIRFWAFLALFYFIINILFGLLYYMAGPANLNGITGQNSWQNFLECFFFSAQTITTVGYGGIHPNSLITNLLSSFEALLGLCLFAVLTGTLYGRFSKANARFIYSPNVIITPYKESYALMFMMANGRNTIINELECSLILSEIREDNGLKKRIYHQSELEVDKVAMLPTNWTLVHQIDENSLLYALTPDEVKLRDLQVIIMFKGYDESFGQTIYSRYSYTADDLVYNVKFIPPFEIDTQTGITHLYLNKLGQYKPIQI